jgi:large subunit ribosomal protein L21
MHAIFQMAGFQYRAEEGSVVRVPLRPINAGDRLEIAEVLLVKDGDTAHIGTPFVPGAKIEAEVVEHSKGEKALSFKYKRRTKYRRTHGHRQDYTDIKINKIIAPAS